MLKQHRRQTKIVWSVECNRLSEINLADVAALDVEAIRVVYSPNTNANVLPLFKLLRQKVQGAPPIMLDMATHNRASVLISQGTRDFTHGEKITIFPESPNHPGSESSLVVRTREWDRLFKDGATIYLGYGNVVLRAIEVLSQQVKAEVIQGGSLINGSEVHVPATRAAASLKNIENDELDAYLAEEIDYLIIPALAVHDILALQNHIQSKRRRCPSIILKIDSVDVADNLGELIELVDGVMISRREMALTTDPAAVPMITKEIIQKGSDLAKLVVTASEMLASMRFSPTPTRAEVSDVANAVMDGTDAVIISEEVSLGRHAARACQMMDRIIREVEQAEEVRPNWSKHSPHVQTEYDAVAFAAYRCARRLNAKAIVCITHSGNTAMRLASFRPPIPILAVTFDDLVCRRLTLVRGVEGLVLNSEPKLDEVLPSVNEKLKKNGTLSVGDRIVFVSLSLSSVGREASNLFTVHQLN